MSNFKKNQIITLQRPKTKEVISGFIHSLTPKNVKVVFAVGDDIVGS